MPLIYTTRGSCIQQKKHKDQDEKDQQHIPDNSRDGMYDNDRARDRHNNSYQSDHYRISSQCIPPISIVCLQIRDRAKIIFHFIQNVINLKSAQLQQKGVSLLLYKVEARDGSISIDKNVVGKIIAKAVEQFGGKVLISNHRGRVAGFAAKIGVADDISYMEINLGKNGLDIRFYILIRFGTSINRVTEQLISTVKKNTEEITGLEVNSVAVVVTGMVSKQTARRNIEVKG
ncbi:Asp23/Gls24 family envelope stress response protein [Anoxybacterium hadale]|uniref:Asp23/Gls24 family envelope stress response protein n=1 Tax=Anoxybacterium hadale TaxID=3408580 RepID=A0ACD1A8X0_9FIRM|nr:Asp23/Gls24 family envelope stress response protein [Clostridiales bacterium]